MVLVYASYLVLFLTLLLCIRLQCSMATLVAWIVGSVELIRGRGVGSGGKANLITGARAVQDKDDDKGGTKPKAKKSRQKLRKLSEPSFTSTLGSPIEEAIEEASEEAASEVTSEESASPSTRSRRRRNRAKKTPPLEDDLGYSFFKAKSADDVNTPKATTSKSTLEDPEEPVDRLGFSFLPVRREKKFTKTKPKLEDLPKSSLIQHYQKKEKVVVDRTKKLNGNSPKEVSRVVEVKESKKVHAKVSYASVASKNFTGSWELLTEEDFTEDNKVETSLIETINEEVGTLENQFASEKTPLEASGALEETFGFINIEKSECLEETTNEFKLENSLSASEENSNQIEVPENQETEELCSENQSFTAEEPKKQENQSLNTLESQNPEIPEESEETEELVLDLTEDHPLEVLETNNQEVIEEIHALLSLKDQLESFIAEESKEQNQLEILNKNQEINSVSTITNQFIAEESQRQETKELSLDVTKESTETFKMSSGIQIRVLTLNDGEHLDSTIYRIEKNWVLQFRLGPSLLGRRVSLYCNYPKEEEVFDRTSYKLLEWTQDPGCQNADDTALLAEITATKAGSFHYYFVYEGTEHQGSGFFLVDPVLKYGHNEVLPLDCVQCQTVLAKSLGSFDGWEAKLRVAKESGYNMIHFTPIQELGASNSSYSLSEQLKLNPIFKTERSLPTFEDVQALIAKLRTEWKMTSICDIVLNHTANESQWLQEHPEVTYNCSNCPHLRPAYLLDASFHQFSMDVSKGVYEDRGIPPQVSTEDHLNSIRYHLHSEVLAGVKIHELFTCDTNKYITEFMKLVRSEVPTNEPIGELVLLQDPQFRRLATSIDMKLALKLYNVYRNDCFDEDSRVKRCVEEFKTKLESLNQKVIDEVNTHLGAAVDNTIAGMRYFRVQEDGPKVREISLNNPLIFRYFTDHGILTNVEEHEVLMYGPNGRFLMAHNGWVMNADPLRNFAAPDSNVYIRRELIAWGDSVKLRYGDKPEDCPFLWDYMRKYVEQTATIFDGIRLDNCHSTPIPVAEYLLDCARRVRPDLYVVAELFTNSDLTDNIFVNRLGITSLIREAMSAWDSHEQGRLVHRYGGSPVGSFYQPRVRPLVPSVAHALFLDLTHDNPSPVEKRSVFDLLPSTALVNMACCASGSNRGYDELVPHHIHVVDETRLYTEWSEDEKLAKADARYVNSKSGIIAAKKALNDLHFRMGSEGFGQVYVDQIDQDIVAVTRHCPETHESYVLVAFTAFGNPPEDAANYQRSIKALRLEGVLEEIVLEATLSHTTGSKYAKSTFERDLKFINGLSEYEVQVKQHLSPLESEVFEVANSGSDNMVQLNFKNFKPGSVAVIKVSLPEEMRSSIVKIRDFISTFSMKKETELYNIITTMTLADLNRALYRCEQEERDEGFGFSTYDIPNFGALVYAGFQGFMSLLSTIRPNNDLGHPMCGNLRDGNWMIDYIWQRLKLDDGTRPLGQWFEENSKSLKSIPRYLVPCYFDVIVTGIYALLIEQSHNLMSDFVKNGSTFVRGLALGSLQFGGYVKSADLPELSPNLSEPRPAIRKLENGDSIQSCVTLSAGLPHFSVGYMRNWGRDTFIALRGLFLLTGRFEDARYHILGYGACLRHGLIPNLLDGGRNPRFNCRDAIWWWLYCIKCYVEERPNGEAILSDVVSRIFPKDDSEAQKAGSVDQPLHDVIQEALTVHFQGLAFRERNAGHQIDEHMVDLGFNNQIGVHPDTGFVFGGNRANCGTWMDKMGSSERAGNKGQPATPRDGSAIELIGLSKAVLTWLDQLQQKGAYPYAHVERLHKNGNITQWTFSQWAEKIQAHFERHFWINTVPEPSEIRADLINKRSIYKDCYGASQDWTDFQLRCNFPIAMVVAPELFDPEHAWLALKQAEKLLLGPLGMKTLDPDDWAYHGDYNNADNSENHDVANGFNYHQGPEWVWPVGFYLRAKLHFAVGNGKLGETLREVKTVLAKHFVELQTSTWRGLPELTNQDGAYCNDSSRTQAWSMSCILEVLHDLQRIEKSHPLIN